MFSCNGKMEGNPIALTGLSRKDARQTSMACVLSEKLHFNVTSTANSIRSSSRTVDFYKTRKINLSLKYLHLSLVLIRKSDWLCNRPRQINPKKRKNIYNKFGKRKKADEDRFS